MKAKILDADLHNLGWEFHADDGRWYWTGGSDGLASQVQSNTSRISALEAGGGGGGLWTDNGDGSISYSGIAKATDFIAE